jgi:ATP phosphoribosyltransferase
MQDGVFKLLEEGGMPVKLGAREYRPTVQNFDVKLLKPQNIIEMICSGTRDVGFAGYDWVQNLGLQDALVELLDTKMDPVSIVVAGKSRQLFQDALEKKTPIVVASEYEKLTLDWIKAKGLNATFVRSFGATECFPPEDADIIVDNTATGSTLKANGLEILDTIATSTTRLYCSKAAYENPAKRQALDDMVVLLNSVLLARKKALVEFNVEKQFLEPILTHLPCMRAPTVSQLHGDAGYSIRIAVDRDTISVLLPKLKSLGATDIMVTSPRQIVK